MSLIIDGKPENISYCLKPMQYRVLQHINTTLSFFPLGTWLGANRTMFEDTFRREVASIAPRLEDPEREEDLVQAGLFMYTPWPELHDPDTNRDAIGRVIRLFLYNWLWLWWAWHWQCSSEILETFIKYSGIVYVVMHHTNFSHNFTIYFEMTDNLFSCHS